jgi:branched-chain amino acid transport system ATP-binding protein
LGEGAGPDQGEAPEVVWKQIGTACQQLAGSLSGGEQQMLAIARALMGRPSLLLDKPRLGLRASDAAELRHDPEPQALDLGE